MTSRRPYWYTKKLKMLPVGIELFSYVKKNLLLQDICIAADHVSDNDPNVKDMNNWGANLFSKCHLNPLPPPSPPLYAVQTPFAVKDETL